MNQQSISFRIVATVLTASMIVSSIPYVFGGPEDNAASQDVKLYRNKQFSPDRPTEAEQILRSQTTPMTYDQLLDYAMTQMVQDRFLAAVVLYEQAVQHAPNNEERVFSLMWEGQALLDSASITDDDNRPGVYGRAGEIFNQASQLSPTSTEAAAMRIIAWTNAGDELETLIAKHDLRRLGVDMEGTEVFLGALTIMALTISGVVATYTVYTLTSDLTQEQKLDRLEHAMTACILAMASLGRGETSYAIPFH